MNDAQRKSVYLGLALAILVFCFPPHKNVPYPSAHWVFDEKPQNSEGIDYQVMAFLWLGVALVTIGLVAANWSRSAVVSSTEEQPEDGEQKVGPQNAPPTGSTSASTSGDPSRRNMLAVSLILIAFAATFIAALFIIKRQQNPETKTTALSGPVAGNGWDEVSEIAPGFRGAWTFIGSSNDRGKSFKPSGGWLFARITSTKAMLADGNTLEVYKVLAKNGENRVLFSNGIIWFVSTDSDPACALVRVMRESAVGNELDETYRFLVKINE